MRLVSHHRPPRAGIDPIDSHELALLTIASSTSSPPRPETIVVLLDDARRGSTIVVVSGTVRHDAVLEVVECIGEAAVGDGRASAAIIASVRPGGGLDAGDVDRWLELSDIADTYGIELVEWFVVGRAVVCPRDLLGEAPRW